jgi:subtilisin family serine protease
MVVTMNKGKIAPRLLITLDKFQQRGHPELVRYTKLMGFVSKTDSPKPARAIVFIKCDKDADLTHLAKEGIQVNQKSGTFRTAFLPVVAMGSLSNEPGVKRIFPSNFLRLKMDVAAEKTHLPPFIQRARLGGKGVIVGIVDTGIDPNHPAFQGRILRIWDQVLSGPGVAEGQYGLECTGNVITASRDTEGHGTHVAGIAAGKDDTYGGVAPKADLVIVKTDMDDAHIADGIRYIFRVGREMGRPVVINLSLGGHFDPHDGTDPLSQIIDQESGPGRIVCCAAGNEGNDNIHAQNVVKKRATSIRFHVPVSAPTGQNVVMLNGWYSGTDTMEVAIATADGLKTPYQGIINADEPYKTYALGDTQVTIATPGPDPGNGDHNFVVVLEESDGRRITPGVWKLMLRGVQVTNGRADIWSMTNMEEQVFFTGKSVKDTMKIGSPGASKSAITVASYNTRVKWKDMSGVQRDVEMEPDTISDFSSEGPMRDERRKPDLTAPGAMIVSACSADSSVNPAYAISSAWRVMAGTSMATPFITGVVALLLERNPNHDPETIKTALQGVCSIPGKPGGSFDNKWGYGFIDSNKFP